MLKGGLRRRQPGLILQPQRYNAWTCDHPVSQLDAASPGNNVSCQSAILLYSSSQNRRPSQHPPIYGLPWPLANLLSQSTGPPSETELVHFEFQNCLLPILLAGRDRDLGSEPQGWQFTLMGHEPGTVRRGAERGLASLIMRGQT